MGYLQQLDSMLRRVARKHRKLFRVASRTWFCLTIVQTCILVLAGKLTDILIPKRANLWLFPAHFYTHDFADNTRAVFEAVKADPRIRKTILIRSKHIPTPDGAVATDVLPMLSLRAIWRILRAKVILIEHSLYLDFAPLRTHGLFFFAFSRRKIVNVWHGVPIKALDHVSSGLGIRPIRAELPYHHIVASSRVDRLAMANAFYPLDPNHVHITGIPRNDFLIRPEDQIPDYYRAQLRRIREIRKGRKLILYAPTYRELQFGGKYYEFSDNEIGRLRQILRKHEAVLAIRMHYHNRASQNDRMIDGDLIHDFDHAIIPDLGMIIRESHAVITDYSGLVVDAIYLEKPIIAFAYDRQHYTETQRGFIYPLEFIFPASICETFEELDRTLGLLLRDQQAEAFKNSAARQILFEHLDDRNSERVVKLACTLAA